MSFLLLFFVVFSNVSRNCSRKEILLYLVSFSPPKSINSFLYIQFLGFHWTFCHAVLKETEEKIIISCILISFTHQVEVFLLIVLSIVAHLFIRLQ